jgi:large subunit ribosomal protein L10
MPNPQNIKKVAEAKEKFSQAEAIYFTDYKGLNVKLMNELRSEFFKSNVDFKIFKKTLTKIAGEEAGYANFEHLMDI